MSRKSGEEKGWKLPSKSRERRTKKGHNEQLAATMAGVGSHSSRAFHALSSPSRVNARHDQEDDCRCHQASIRSASLCSNKNACWASRMSRSASWKRFPLQCCHVATL